MTLLRGFPSAPSAALTLLLLAGGPAQAGASTAWVEAPHSQARLIAAGAMRASAGVSGAPALLGGVEIALAPRFITYWRDPGDAGVPPSFDFAGSTNLASAVVRYPAPTMLDEAGAKAYGYRDDVVFPVVVTPIDAGKPVRLHLRLDYAACHDLCLPARADLDLTLDGSASADAGKVEAALAAVPRASKAGDTDGPVRILGVTRSDEGFTVEARGAEGADLFVEASEGWAFEAGPGAPAGDDRTMFPVKRLEQPKGQTTPVGPVLLTLVAPAGAIEVPVQLDAASPKP